jgi:hypothetical protein
MTFVSREPNIIRIDDVAELLNHVVDAKANSRHAHELLEEVSQLLWAVSSLDPDAEDALMHSDHVADLVARSPY